MHFLQEALQQKDGEDKQILIIVVSRAVTIFTLKKVKGQGQDMAPIKRACHKDHTCQISMLYHFILQRI